jgi:putative hemolysin
MLMRGIRVSHVAVWGAAAATLVLPGCSGNAPQPAELANPASIYCEEQGGRVEILDADGGQQGMCVFPDGATCEEWAFYRGECDPAEVTS